MSRSKRHRLPFVITVASTLAACGGSTAGDGLNTGGTGATGSSGGSGATGSGGSGNVSGSGGGGTSGSGGSAQCPESFPNNGDPCALPSGTTCSFEQGSCCPAWQATCNDGAWQSFPSSCNPPPPDPCPAEPPPHGSACGPSDPCGNPYQYCTYGKCEDGSPHILAQCIGGAWSVDTANCALPACETLTPCECFDRSDCKALTDTCICPCDYSCPGKPPCDCDCGGGKFLGCAPN